MMDITDKLLKSVIPLLCAALLVACGKGSTEDNAEPVDSQVRIYGAGSTFVSPLMWRWIEQYEDQNTQAVFDYQAVGSGEGIDRFIAGGIDFGASDSAMNDAEIARAKPPAGRGVKLIPITAGEVVVAYNIPGLNGTLKLPRDVYVDIFLGRITHWDDDRIVSANPGLNLPSKRVQVVARRDSSGTTYAFTNHLSAISDAWRTGPGTGKLIDWPGSAMVALGNEGVSQRLKITDNSIGYIEYGFARRLGLSMAMLQNRAGNYVAPGPEGGKQALYSAAENIPADLRLFLPDPAGSRAYPVVSLVWLLLHRNYLDRAEEQILKDAVEWSLTDGQAIADEMGYIPLPSNLVDRALIELRND